MSAQPDRPPVVKILLIGPSSSGKTSLLKRYVDDIFDPDDTSTTIGVDFREKKVAIGGKPHRLLLHDTAGQERFRTLTSSYYRNAHGVLLVYDISNRDSFQSMPRWFEEAETYAPPGAVKILVGNKLDRASSRAVTTEEGQALAETLNAAAFLEVSARTREHVAEPFTKLVQTIVTTPGVLDRDKNGIQNGARTVNVGQAVQNNTGGYCSC